MKDSKNLILAVVLSALVLLGWTWASNRYFPTANPPSTKVEGGKQQPLPQPSAQPAGARVAEAVAERAAALASTPRVQIQTPSLAGSINLKGAQIDDLVLLNQRQTIAKNSPPVRLLSPLGAPGAYVAAFGWTARAGQAPALDAVWTADSQTLSPGHPVTLTTEMAGGTRYQIKIAVDDGYLFTIQQSVANASGEPISVRPIGLVSRGQKSPDPTAGPTRLARSACSTARPIMRSIGRTSMRARRESFNSLKRMVGLHRQILANGACAAGRHDRRIPPQPKRRLPGRLCRLHR